MNHEELHIIASILSGRTEQFAYFLDTYGPQVFHLIVRMVGSPEDAEELTQDCFMKAFTHLSSFHGNSSFSTWIYRIAYNEATSALRKKDKELLSFDDRMWNSLSDTEIDEELDTENEVQIQKLQQALTQLKPDEQALVTLFYEEEKNIEEIAYIFHLTESNVKVKLHRIRKKFILFLVFAILSGGSCIGFFIWKYGAAFISYWHTCKEILPDSHTLLFYLPTLCALCLLYFFDRWLRKKMHKTV